MQFMAVDLLTGLPSVCGHLESKVGGKESEVVGRTVQGLELDHREEGGLRRDAWLECNQA